MKKLLLLIMTMLSLSSYQLSASSLESQTPVAMPDSFAYDCVADFYYDNFGTSVSFYNNSWASSPIIAYSWDFGDNSTSTDINPTHTYTSPGIYYVTLTISTNTCSTSMILEVWVDMIIIQDCYADFSYWSTGTNVIFTDYSYSLNPMTSWYWQFGDGATSTLQNPIHQYSTAGWYDVTLTITADSCTSSAIYTVYLDSTVVGDCMASFGWDYDYNNPYLLNFYDFSFALAPITSWEWNFGDSTTSTLVNPNHLYTTQGVYEVSLTITSDSCTSTYSEWISVGNNSSGDCQADFWYYSYSGFNIEFIDASWAYGTVTSWLWDFGDGTTSSLQSPIHQYSSTGVYPVSLTIQSDSCSSTVFYPVYVDSVIVPECYADFYVYNNGLTAIFQDYSFSLGTVTSWYWEFGDGTTSTDQNPIHIYPSAGYYDVSFTIVSDSCTSTTILGVYIDSIIYYNCYAGFYYQANPNDPNALQFIDNSYSMDPITSWQWDFGDGTTSSDPYPYHIFNAPGAYLVTLTIFTAPLTYPGDSCTSTYSEWVYAGNSYPGNCNAYFNYYMSGTTTVEFVDLSSSLTPVQSWFWDFGDGSSSTQQNPTHSYTYAGNFYVSLTIATDSCYSTNYMFVCLPSGNGNTLPSGGANWDPYAVNCQAFYMTNVSGLTVDFVNVSMINTFGNVSYNWNFGDGNYSFDATPSHTYATAGVYHTMLTMTVDSCTSMYETVIYLDASSSWGVGCQAAFFPILDSSANSIQFMDMSLVDLQYSTTYSWDFGDNTYSFDQNPIHSYSQPGVYEVYHEISNGSCVSGITIQIDLVNSTFMPMAGYSPISIDENTDMDQVSIYPNPVEDILNLTTAFTNSGEYSLAIFDISGKLVRSEQVFIQREHQTTQVSVNNLASGSYMIQLKGSNGSKTLQFVK